MRIGFSKTEITPPIGMELGGYAGYRPCGGVHDPLYCKTVVLEQEDGRYCLMAFDLLCVDESLYERLAEAVAELGIARERLIACAIHSHASAVGLLPGEGPLAPVNTTIEPGNPEFRDYMEQVVQGAAAACAQAAEGLEPFRVRAAKGPLPAIGSERHTGAVPNEGLTVLEFRTESGKQLVVYNFPCHPTVTNAANLLASADFAAGIEDALGAEMAVFLNGAAGDISTRFTRRESSFAECERMGRIAAEGIRKALEGAAFQEPEPLRGCHGRVRLEARAVETPEAAQAQLREHTARWQAAVDAGAGAAEVRILKSYVEGAGVNLEFARTMEGIREFRVPVTVFRFCGMDFMTVPGELFSTLRPEGMSVIAYANGYYRYICDTAAYDAGYYEAMAAIVARGQGERLMEKTRELLGQLGE